MQIKNFSKSGFEYSDYFILIVPEGRGEDEQPSCIAQDVFIPAFGIYQYEGGSEHW